jgi:hypothetical protein
LDTQKVEHETSLTTAYINRIATVVPPHDVHSAFVRFARTLLADPHARLVFDRLAAKGQVSARRMDGHRVRFL